MLIIPLKTPQIVIPNENLEKIFEETLKFNFETIKERDILVITEKVAAICQGRIKNLSEISFISDSAKELSIQYKMDPRFVELILSESTKIYGGVPGMLLTVKSGIFIANAGIDRSNAPQEDMYILWPSDPYHLAEDLMKYIKNKYGIQQFGILISDSRVQPLKRGVVGVAIGVAGFQPIDDCRGKKDLFGYKMHYTIRAIADQLTDAALTVMGECNEQTPFALIRDAPVSFTDQLIDPELMLMPLNEDLFVQIFQKYEQNRLK